MSILVFLGFVYLIAVEGYILFDYTLNEVAIMLGEPVCCVDIEAPNLNYKIVFVRYGNLVFKPMSKALWAYALVNSP